MKTGLYNGYSSVANSGINTALHDIKLVNQDMANHFHTIIGERVGRPTYGSIIPELLFDIGDIRTESLVVQDINRIVGEDPRVNVLENQVNVDLTTHSITANVKLHYLEINMDAWFTLVFKQ